MAAHRYRVRQANKTFTDPGPDLLRPLDNAVTQLRSLLGLGNKYEYRVDKGTPVGPVSRRKVLAAAKKGGYDTFGVSVVGGDLVAEVKHERITLIATPCASPAVQLYRSLAEFQFGNLKFAGAFVYPDYEPGGWSDHAWGDAFDETPPDAAGNDALFDWYTRMAQAGCMKYGYVIGSKKGVVWSTSAPDYQPVVGGGDSSHLWHNHMSVINHHGAKPPTTTGYC